MTCIVGIQQEGRVWIGGDSCGGGPGWETAVRADAKVGFTESEAVAIIVGVIRPEPQR